MNNLFLAVVSKNQLYTFTDATFSICHLFLQFSTPELKISREQKNKRVCSRGFLRTAIIKQLGHTYRCRFQFSTFILTFSCKFYTFHALYFDKTTITVCFHIFTNISELFICQVLPMFFLFDTQVIKFHLHFQFAE